MKRAILNKIKRTCQNSGVYFFKDRAGRIIYIGKALNLKKRLQSHLKTGPAGSDFLEFASELDCIETDDEKQAMLLENELIKKYQPKFNIQWRDDKSFFWVNFTKDEWPRVEAIHQNSARNNFDNPIGPFVNGRELKKTLRALRKILPYKTCKNLYEKPCLQWHLGLCPAHSIRQAELVSGSKELTKSRNKPFGIKLEAEIFGIKGRNKEKQKEKYFQSLNLLRQLLRLYADEPIRVEAYDISNIQGVYATGSMIVFYDSKPEKSEYRKFRIKTVRGANDIAMLKEVLKRRFNHPEWPYPDLVLIDGGKAQLSAALSQIKFFTTTKLFGRPSNKFSMPNRAIISLAKKEEEIYTEYSDRALKISALPEALQNLFKHVRDEAHRFAIFYYRFLHGQKFTPKANRRDRKKARKS
ncbi:MAG: GIY-YIG nuclease family protein [Candidatus Portnoybacteria bacterium]|nr:GIY-YIG nuclease family protein [Candidatus Portnoybacteria bacterium]